MIFSGYIFSIVIFPYYFLLHNVRIKRYFSSNLIPTNYFALCSSRNFIICLYIQHKSHSTDYSSKEWLSLFLSDTYGKYTRIFIFTQKTSYHLAGFHCIFKTTYMLTFPENHSSCDSWSSPHPISNSQLHVLPHFHLCPIYLVVFKGVYFFRMGYLILRGASRLDAFSVYPFRAWLLGRRLGSLTDAPAARPSRSSRTKDSSSQISYAHAG